MIEDNEVGLKTITMIMTDSEGQLIKVSKDFSMETTWPPIAGLFYQFLAGMSYQLQPEDVSADWEG